MVRKNYHLTWCMHRYQRRTGTTASLKGTHSCKGEIRKKQARPESKRRAPSITVDSRLSMNERTAARAITSRMQGFTHISKPIHERLAKINRSLASEKALMSDHWRQENCDSSFNGRLMSKFFLNVHYWFASLAYVACTTATGNRLRIELPFLQCSIFRS